ncbi:MAG: hypothetical protein JWM15_4252, partial [Cryptosporangiaceae bacterium]|nr:hypothetical protein [Cryptosporangiaceae bacterium]
YSADLFDRSTVESMAARLGALLRAAAADPDQRVGDVELLTPDERARLRRDGTGTARREPSTALPALVAEHVARTPHAPAVRRGDTVLSYAELDARANRLAHRLLAAGVTPEARVALVQEHSIDVVVSILAVLKAGGAYVPVDAHAPLSRIEAALRESATSVVLTHRDRDLDLGGDLGVTVLSCADDGPWPDHAPDVPLTPDQLAYVMFTSGSTGTPKGIAITHANVTAFATDTAFHPDTHQRVLLHSALAFDASTYELWTPLLHGGQIIIAPPGDLDPAALATAITHGRVTAACFTSALFNLLVDQAAPALAGLHDIFTGGDVASTTAMRRITQTCPDTTVHNGYGPTETTTFATLHQVRHPFDHTRTVPIGAPLNNTHVYVLDPTLQPVPPGVTGELYIAGTGLARGYIDRPALTAERFVADPHGTPGTRMYRTGDLARWNHHGNLDFTGRADRQIKLRGFRIEPGEIEATLTHHPDVAQVAVILREDRPGIPRLVAYIVPADQVPADHPDADTLRRHVAATLPDYMIPTAFLPLDHLPLTPNGKLDRDALPPPPDPAGTGREPRTPTEQTLRDLFAETLGLDQITIDDNFFDLGGHSLLATRLISRIHTTLHTDLTIRDLFEAPTVATLTTHLNPDDEHTARPPLVPATRPERLPLSYAQQRLWFLTQLEGPSATYNIPLTIRLSGELDTDALRNAFADLMRRHEALRTVYLCHDGSPYQQILPADTVALALPTTTVHPDELEAALAEHAAAVFDLAAEVPIRAQVFHLGDDEHVLLIVAHHIAADGWSMAPLTRDLATAYAARARREAPDWTPLPVQYADYARWQRELLGDDTDAASVAAEQLGYWRQALAGLPDTATLPADRPRPAASTYRGGVQGTHVPAPMHSALTDLARDNRVTLFMLAQAAVATVLTRSGAGEDLPIGSPVAGRTDEALDELIGFFVNTLVLRTDTSGDPTFRELLARVR